VRVIDNSQSNWIRENTVVDNEYGIDVGGADDNHILGNDVSDSAVDGFFVTGNLNTVEQNTVVDSGRHGYNVSGRFNSFTGNTSSSNGGYGFWDETAGGAGDAGTDNTYSGNVCFSNVLGQSFPDGLCAEPINSPPHADAGLDRLIEWSGGNIAVTLDGSGSSDPDGDTLSYAWSGGFGEGFATGVNPTVTFNELGDFEVTLTVDDGRGGTDTDSVIITLAAYCEGRPATITGTLGDDLLVGTPAADVIVALDGNDAVHAQGGNDVVCGGPGADRLRGQGGHDTVVGNDGFDLLWGGGGRDRLFGSEGNDVLRGHGGKDRLYGEGGDDSLYGGGNADHLHGGSGTDYVHGGGATDVCSGESVVACE
jgi:parallel beta-helix repeat protein